MRTVSWVLLAIVGILTLLGALASAGVAYRSDDDQLGPVTLRELVGPRTEVGVALRGRRSTAAAYAAAFATVFLFVVLIPYRRGDVWSWWALLAATLVLFVLTALRIPALGTHAGVGSAGLQLAITVVGLLLDLNRLRMPHV